MRDTGHGIPAQMVVRAKDRDTEAPVMFSQRILQLVHQSVDAISCDMWPKSRSPCDALRAS